MSLCEIWNTVLLFVNGRQLEKPIAWSLGTGKESLHSSALYEKEGQSSSVNYESSFAMLLAWLIVSFIRNTLNDSIRIIHQYAHTQRNLFLVLSSSTRQIFILSFENLFVYELKTRFDRALYNRFQSRQYVIKCLDAD